MNADGTPGVSGVVRIQVELPAVFVRSLVMLVVMIFGTFIAVLNQTLVTPALPSIMIETSVDASTAQWLTTGFTLVNAIMIPITAFLIDRFSMRNLFLVAMAIFTAGSAIAGWGPNFPTILAGRLVQAAGEGVMMPLVMTELMLMFPVEKRGTAMGLYGLVIGFAPALGLRLMDSRPSETGQDKLIRATRMPCRVL